MTERLYFCWERASTGEWCGTVYHGDKPGKKMEGNVTRSAIHEVPDECVVNGEIVWGRLYVLFPKPKETDE